MMSDHQTLTASSVPDWGDAEAGFSRRNQVSDACRAPWFTLAVGMAILLCCTGIFSALANSPTRTIGVEGRISMILSREDYQPRPLDDRTEFILRIESVTPAGTNQYRYEMYYMGLEPEHFDLADYLVLPDGSRPAELEGQQVFVQAILPEDHDGQLTQYAPQPFPFIGGYRVVLATAGVLWLGGIAAFAWSSRKRHAPAESQPVIVLPTFAERLRPLVEAAARGELTTEQKARIERLLLGFWRDRLNLPELRMAEAIARLRENAQAGALLRALERWLHQRSGASAAEINALLEPYRQAPPQEPQRTRA